MQRSIMVDMGGSWTSCKMLTDCALQNGAKRVYAVVVI